MTENKTRRKRRTKANIVASIESAAITEITQNGFVASLVTNIIKSAKIEPQVFYNRYKDINDFYDAFVRRYDASLQDLLQEIGDPIISKQGVSSMLKSMLRSINEDPVTLELLRWELSEKNKTTSRTSLLRELNFQPVVQGFWRTFKGSGIDIVGIFTILVGGIYYISLHKKLSPFYGIDVNTSEGREQIEHVLEHLVALVFDAKNHTRRELEIADRLRACGVREDIIAKAIGPSVSSASDANKVKASGEARPIASPQQ